LAALGIPKEKFGEEEWSLEKSGWVGSGELRGARLGGYSRESCRKRFP
jgi:hypothetical protein